jgi:chromosome segregation ATPase
MARRRAIEADELFETANRLQSEGKDVTAVALLDALGGGSLRTIYKLLEEWQQRRPALVIPTPEVIPGSVQAAFANAWRLANQEAGREVTAVKEKAAEEIAAASQQFQGVLEIIGKLESEAEADAQLIDELKAKVAELQIALQNSETDNARYRATAEQLRHQVKSQEAELERMHKEVDKERSVRQAEIQRITTAAETAAEKAAHQVEALNKAVSEVQNKVQQLEKEKSDAENKRIEVERRLEASEEASKNDRSERDAAIKEAAELRGLSEGLKTHNSELLSKLGRDNKSDRKN